MTVLQQVVHSAQNLKDAEANRWGLTPRACLPTHSVCDAFDSASDCTSNSDSDLHDSSCIIFDWDDTLFPTWYVKNVVQISHLENDPTMGPLFRQAMSLHAAYVKELLQTARKFARVAIITLGTKAWVRSMAQKYWLDFDFEQLLSELDIPIFYARDHLAAHEKASDAEGVNLWVVAKRNAMLKALRQFRKKSGCALNNMICIGDNEVEHDAMEEVAWSMSCSTNCKSVLFRSEPSLGDLTDQVKFLTAAIGKMVELQDDCYLDMADDAGSDLLSLCENEAQ
jgi:hypothetical protein